MEAFLMSTREIIIAFHIISCEAYWHLTTTSLRIVSYRIVVVT